MGIIRSKKYFKELRSHHASPQVLGLILPYHKRDLDSELNEPSKSPPNSGKKKGQIPTEQYPEGISPGRSP